MADPIYEGMLNHIEKKVNEGIAEPRGKGSRTKDQGASELFGKRLEDLTDEERQDVNAWVKESITNEQEAEEDEVKEEVEASFMAKKRQEYSAMNVEALQAVWNKVGIGPENQVPNDKETLILELMAEVENEEITEEAKVDERLPFPEEDVQDKQEDNKYMWSEEQLGELDVEELKKLLKSAISIADIGRDPKWSPVINKIDRVLKSKGVDEQEIAEKKLADMSDEELEKIFSHLEKVSRVGFNVDSKINEVEAEIKSRKKAKEESKDD